MTVDPAAGSDGRRAARRSDGTTTAGSCSPVARCRARPSPSSCRPRSATGPGASCARSSTPRPTGSSRRARPAGPVAAAAVGSTSSCRRSEPPGWRSSRTRSAAPAGSTTPSSSRGGVDPDGYRTTIRVAPTADGRAGYHAEASHDVVAAPECLIAHPTLRALLPAAPSGGRRRADAAGVRGHGRARRPMGRRQGHGARAAGGHAGSAPAAVLHEDVAGHRLRVSMGSFFQSGPQAAGLLVDTVRRAGARAVGGRGRRRRVRRCRDVQRLRHRSVEPRRRHRDVAGGRRRCHPQPRRTRRPRSCGARSGAGGRRPGWTWTS